VTGVQTCALPISVDISKKQEVPTIIEEEIVAPVEAFEENNQPIYEGN
jgi:hypothetical protein